MTETMWWGWLLLLSSMDGTHSLTYNTFLEQQLTATCPYTRFCTVGPSIPASIHKYIPCCMDCSCQTDCYKLGTCCPDYQNVQTTEEVIAPCSAPSLRNSKSGEFVLDGRLNYDRSINFYHIFNTCTPNFRDQSIVAKCLSPDPNSLHENNIVSDGGYVFQNPNCALCNGVRPVHTWILKVLCIPRFANSVFASTYTFTEILSLEWCSVVFVPPDEAELKIASYSQCFKTHHSTCNETGSWGAFDSNIKRACESSGNVYEYIVERDYKVYKNVFCFLCNTNANMTRADECTVGGDGAGKESVATQVVTAIVDSARLAGIEDKSDQDHSPSQQGDTRTIECSTTEIYDRHLDKCRHLNCPITLIPLTGACVEVFREVTGLTLVFAISAPLDDISMATDSQQQFHDLAYSVMTLILKQLDFKAKQCNQCKPMAHLDDEFARIVLEFSVVTSKHCQASTMIDTMYRWKSTDQIINISNTPMHVEMDFRTFTRYKFPITFPIEDSEPSACMAGVEYLSEFFYCPFVEIAAEEYDQLMSHHSDDIDEESFKLIKKHGGNSTYRICVDQYLAPISNQAMSNQYASGVVTTFALVLVMGSTK